jgi:hypothetical protein
MASFKVHAGSFGPGTAFLFSHVITPPGGESFHGSQIASVEVATEESVKRVAGTVGWGAAGALVFGPVGLLAGLLAGGRDKEVTFVLVTRDGQRMLATADVGTYRSVVAASMTPLPPPRTGVPDWVSLLAVVAVVAIIGAISC